MLKAQSLLCVGILPLKYLAFIKSLVFLTNFECVDEQKKLVLFGQQSLVCKSICNINYGVYTCIYYRKALIRKVENRTVLLFWGKLAYDTCVSPLRPSPFLLISSTCRPSLSNTSDPSLLQSSLSNPHQPSSLSAHRQPSFIVDPLRHR